MRVLMVIRPASGGMREHVALLSRGLVAREVEVDVAAPEGSDILVESVAEGIDSWPIDITGPLSPVRDWRASRELAEVVGRGGYDVVHAHGFKAGLVARLAAREHAVPVVVTAHTHLLARRDLPAWRAMLYRRAERSLAPLVAAWIAISDSVRGELVDDFGLPAERIHMVRNAIDLASFLEERDRESAREALGLSDDLPVVGTAVRLAPQKGLDTLIDAWPYVLERVPHALLVIGGKGPLESELRVKALARGILESIAWPGHVSDMPGLFAALDVFVSASELEGFSLVLAEAQAAGAAIVATSAGGAAETVSAGRTALVVPPRDPFALAEAVVKLLRDPQLAGILGANGRERARAEFAPERMVAETLRVYESVVGVPQELVAAR